MTKHIDCLEGILAIFYDQIIRDLAQCAFECSAIFSIGIKCVGNSDRVGRCPSGFGEEELRTFTSTDSLLYESSKELDLRDLFADLVLNLEARILQLVKLRFELIFL